MGRATGNQRVCVNTHVFPDQLLERLSDKRLKISALNPGSTVPQLVVLSSSVAGAATINHMLRDLITKCKQARRKRKMDTNKRGEQEEEGAEADQDEVPEAKKSDKHRDLGDQDEQEGQLEEQKEKKNSSDDSAQQDEDEQEESETDK